MAKQALFHITSLEEVSKVRQFCIDADTFSGSEKFNDLKLEIYDGYGQEVTLLPITIQYFSKIGQYKMTARTDEPIIQIAQIVVFADYAEIKLL